MSFDKMPLGEWGHFNAWQSILFLLCIWYTSCLTEVKTNTQPTKGHSGLSEKCIDFCPGRAV